MADEELGYCKIDKLKLSSRSANAVKEIRGIMEQGDLFTLSLGVVPIVDIFLGKKAVANQMIDIAAYDWVEFSNVAQDSSKIVRSQIRKVAEPMTWVTYGKEGQFWKCVSDATL